MADKFIDFKPLSHDDVIKLCALADFPWPDKGLTRILVSRLVSVAYQEGLKTGIADGKKLSEVTNQW